MENISVPANLELVVIASGIAATAALIMIFLQMKKNVMGRGMFMAIGALSLYVCGVAQSLIMQSFAAYLTNDLVFAIVWVILLMLFCLLCGYVVMGVIMKKNVEKQQGEYFGFGFAGMELIMTIFLGYFNDYTILAAIRDGSIFQSEEFEAGTITLEQITNYLAAMRFDSIILKALSFVLIVLLSIKLFGALAAYIGENGDISAVVIWSVIYALFWLALQTYILVALLANIAVIVYLLTEKFMPKRDVKVIDITPEGPK
ncbi:MAG: hypothetical protein LBR25_10145 [Erysipelotrichaceae bacterium]|jgi:hypothetical protein|nr:hypothetical protein [Erysipelotrichaceae bacterium]